MEQMQHTLEEFAEWSSAEQGPGEERMNRQLERFVEELQKQTGGPLGYRLRRIMLTNFWLYGYQEFEIPHGRLFLAIGVSLAGNVNASDRIRPLRFLITDGSRLGDELDTIYETGNKHDKRAYDHARFKQLLEGHGIICDTQAEYERQVARYLFGFNDEKDFQKLIDLLLILRRPNLSSELSFSKVHDYLKQSLRKISGETTSHVIGTIDRIDAINSEIERIQEAFESADRLHRAQQQVALIRAQLAACEYTGAHLVEDSVQSRVNRLRKDLHTADNERSRAEERSQTFQAEY